MDLLILLLSIAFAMILFLIPFRPKSMKNCYIIRGIPGSGKSTLADKIAVKYNTNYTETDQFIYNDKGEYEWTEERHARAIDLCHEMVSNKVAAGDPTVIVTGVYTRWRAMRDYVEMAQANGYTVHIIECKGDYGSIHGLTDERMETFRKRFIPNSGLPQMQGIVYETHP